MKTINKEEFEKENVFEQARPMMDLHGILPEIPF